MTDAKAIIKNWCAAAGMPEPSDGECHALEVALTQPSGNAGWKAVAEIRRDSLGHPHAVMLSAFDASGNGLEHGAKLYAAQATRDDDMLTQALEERDRAEGWADGLAGLVGQYFGEDVGEHSNLNSPWERAKAILENALAAQASAEPRLNKPAKVGHARFGVGVKWSTVIGAAQRHYENEVTPEKEAERIASGREKLAEFQQQAAQAIGQDPVELFARRVKIRIANMQSGGALLTKDVLRFLNEEHSALLSKGKA